MLSGRGILIRKASLILLAAFIFLQTERTAAPPSAGKSLATATTAATTSASAPAPNKPIVDARAEAAEKSAAMAKFAPAAEQNSRLKTSVVWNFGGKQQQGWQIYEPLIRESVKVENGAGDNEFAAGLSQWQKSNGLAPSGTLEEATFNRFVAAWQTHRLKQRTQATPEELTEGAAADFYDPGRSAELRRIERETYAAYKKMVAAAAADKTLNLRTNADGTLAAGERFLKIVSSHRSPEYQKQLRAASPNAGSAALAVNFSPHFTGRALDIYVGGDPVSTEDANRLLQTNTPVYRWLVANAPQFGFCPYFYEPWHWEYVGASENSVK